MKEIVVIPDASGGESRRDDPGLRINLPFWFAKNRGWLAMAAAGLAGLCCGVALTRKLHGPRKETGQSS